MKKIIFSFLLLTSTLNAGIPVEGEYFSPSKRIIERESWEVIEKHLLKNKISPTLIPIFDEIIEQEDWGHIGYHGANQEYRIYQDIIRITLEEILALTIREDFHFLRVPGDTALNLNNMQSFAEFWKKVDNKNDVRAKQLLSMNYAVYSNFDIPGSCSIYLFSDDNSKHEIDYKDQLSPFYKKLGIKTGALKQLFYIAHKWLDADGGILLQISETSHFSDPNNEAYNFADLQCYPCKRGGYPHGTGTISTHFERFMSEDYIKSETNVSPQLRLLINNKYTLNPASYLTIRRYDLYDEETKASYEAELRECIRNLKFDPILVDIYVRDLLTIWFNGTQS